mgnify:CR=1 FL=1
MKVRSLVCLLLAASSISSAKVRKPAAKTDMEKKIMTAPVEEWKGQQGGPLEPGHQLVTDLKGWKALAARLGLHANAPDFSKSIVVAVFVGERPTGGFSASFENPAAEGDDLLVRYRIKKPAPTSFVTQAFAQPWKARTFPRPKGKVIVELLPQ